MTIELGCPPPRRGETFTAGDRFNFTCHPGLACFGQCCRDINILLTPYDVLRLKNYLGITSGDFLVQYTHIFTARHSSLPVIILKMREEQDLTCSFLTGQGCRVYPVRPWSCRMAPLDQLAEDKFTLAFSADFCLGLQESAAWTPRQWMQDQGLAEYGLVEESFSRIPSLWPRPDDARQQAALQDLFLTLVYDLDRLRYCLEHSRELVVALGLAGRDFLPEDDVALLRHNLFFLAAGQKKEALLRLAALIKRAEGSAGDGTA
ncbi:MAG: YkgJ family cysteine cluster protein [Desulfurispora sp.]|uniref:YkgJ family cysteine cluster protein n=1 Tax=Desulfurispora sp. TaxID=3014275 RepID=UPI004049EC41